MQYKNVRIKIYTQTSTIVEFDHPVFCFSQDEYDAFMYSTGLVSGSLLLTPANYAMVNDAGGGIIQRAPCYVFGTNYWKAAATQFANVFGHPVNMVSLSTYPPELTFESTRTVTTDKHYIDEYSGLYVEFNDSANIANSKVAFGYKRPDATYTYALSNCSMSAPISTGATGVGNSLLTQQFCYYNKYEAVYASSNPYNTVDSFGSTYINWEIPFIILDANGICTDCKTLNISYGSKVSDKSLCYIVVGNHNYTNIKNFYTGLEPYDPPWGGGGDNPYEPGGHTEPEVGPTGGTWTLNEDVIPVVPNPNSDLGLGIMRAYSMNKVQLTDFSNALWSQNVLTALKTMVSNPLDVVISLMSYPFEITRYSAEVEIGFAFLSQWVPSSAHGNPLSSEIEVLNFGSITIPRYSGTFYDYAPYSSALLWLPYYGYVPLKINEILGKTLDLVYFVNLISGNFTAILSTEHNPQIMAQYQGTIARPLPLTSGDFFKIVQTTAHVAMQAAATAAGAGLAGGKLPGFIPAKPATENSPATDAHYSVESKHSMARSVSNSLESIAASAGHITRSGDLGGVSGRTSTQEPYILLTLPHQNTPSNQRLMGYPTNLPGPLANYKGYTEVRAIHLIVPGATASELAELQTILESGILITE